MTLVKNFDNSEFFSEITKAFNCYQDRLREDNPQAQKRAGSHNHLQQNQSCYIMFKNVQCKHGIG